MHTAITTEGSEFTQSSDKRIDFSVIIVSRDIGESLLSKLESVSKLRNQESIVSILIGLDGACVSEMPDNLKLRLDEIRSTLSIQFIETATQIGKNAVINKILPHARGTVLIFTDVDAIISSDSLVVLGHRFVDPEVGAIAGLRVIVDEGKFGTAQSGYVDFDTQIKRLEMRFLGCVTSCDGKIYAIRSQLVDAIPLHVTDDTFIGLGALLKNKKLVFDSNLIANIGRPAKNPLHEFDRRRRVTTRGLHSLVERRSLFKFTLYGWYSYCLFANKLCRRFAPLSLALVLVLSTFAFGSVFGLISLLLILLLILASFSYLGEKRQDNSQMDTPAPASITSAQSRKEASVSIQVPRHQPLAIRLLGAGAYFLLGMSAMTLGAFDFLRGKKISKWEPRKSL